MDKVTVLYFAGARDAAGVKSDTVEVDGASTASDVLRRIIKMHPGLGPMKGSVRLTVNKEVVAAAARVEPGDEVGVLPPVAGG
ncbi:MAG: MoaD/ThiS family protein [Nitrososphaerota archaeon]|nr:MoaD/ThiS family protein [Nitrososphaerota archaeon]